MDVSPASMSMHYYACLVSAEARRRRQVSLELELQIIVGCHVRPEKEIQVFLKNNQRSSLLSHLSSALSSLFNTPSPSKTEMITSK